MKQHVHPMSSWSGVYYVSVPPAEGGCLVLSDPRPGAMMVTMGQHDEQFSESRQVCPTAGLLVLFPAWVPHSVTPLEADGAVNATCDADGSSRASPGAAGRIAVAFNVHTAEQG